MLLNGKCSWSYKSLKADDKIKKNERSTNSLCDKNLNTSSLSFSENSTEVYNFEVLNKKNTRYKVLKNSSFELPGVEKDDLCYDFNEVSVIKKTKKSQKKPIKNKKNIQNRHELPRATSRALRNKKRINYADSNEESDLNLDRNEDVTLQMVLKNTRTNQNNISRDSEYSDEEELVFQTRYSDKYANLSEIANTIESDSNDIIENLEERNKTTTSPTILKLTENLRNKSTEQTSTDNQISFVDSSLVKSDSQSNSQSESEKAFSYNPEVENTETNRKYLTPEELDINIDIEADIFEKCQKVFSEINTKYKDFKLEKYYEESKKEIVGDTNRAKENTMSKFFHQSKKANENSLITENTCERRNSNGCFNKNDEIVTKNRKKAGSKNNLPKKKTVNQICGIQGSSSNPELNEERLEIKIMQKYKQADFYSETLLNNEKSQKIEKDSKQNTETKENMSVEDFIEWQSSSEDRSQSILREDMFLKKMGSSLNWDKTLVNQMDCNRSLSSFNQEKTKLENFPEESLHINIGTSKTNSMSLKHYFDNNSSHSAESQTISENDEKIYSFQNKIFKTKDISPNKDQLSSNEKENSDFISKKRDTIISTNQHGLFLKKENLQSKCKQVNDNKKVRKEKLVEATQEGNQKINTFNISKDTDFTKQNFKNKGNNQRFSESKPRTWEELEIKLLSETDNDLCVVSPKSYREIESRDNLWTEKKEFEIQKITKAFQTISKGNERNLSFKKLENKHRNLDNSQVLPITKSPNLNIINKAIQAMEKCTSGYVSPFKNDFNSNLQEYEENDDLNEYSISVHSTIIHSSKNKLSATNTFFQRMGKIDKNVKEKISLKNKVDKCNLTEKNSKTPTAKISGQKEKKVVKFSKQPKTYTMKNNMQIMKNFQKITDENSLDDSQNFNFDLSNYSNTEDVCTLYNPTVFSDAINSDKIEQNFHPKEKEVESRYSFRKRKIKSTLEKQNKKLKIEEISPAIDLQSTCNQNNASYGKNLNRSTKANGRIVLKNDLYSPKTNLNKKFKSEDDVDSRSGSNFSFNCADEIMGLYDSLETESNTKKKSKKVNSPEKRQDTNLNNQSSSSNLETKGNLESDCKKYTNANSLKRENEAYLAKENKCINKSDFNCLQTKGKCKNKAIKKQDAKKNYKDYLKKLFQSEIASNGKNIENDEDESIKQIQNKGNGKTKEIKLMMTEDDELFSISSEDSQIDENGDFSEDNLTQNSGLFFDVLDEKDK